MKLEPKIPPHSSCVIKTRWAETWASESRNHKLNQWFWCSAMLDGGPLWESSTVLEQGRYTYWGTQSRFVSHGTSSSLAFLLFTMSRGDEPAAHVSAHRVLCLQSCVDKAPSSPGRGMMEQDQSTAVGLVHTAVHRPRVPVLASGLDPLAKYYWIMTHKDWLLINSFSVYMKA